MNLQDLSEINFGLVWEDRRLAAAYDANDFAPPYDEAIKILQKPRGSKEEVVKKIAPKFLQAAHDAVKRMNGLGDDTSYDGALSQAAEAYRLGKLMESKAYLLQKGETVDLLQLYGKITSHVSGQATGLMRADQIDYENYKPFMLSGWKEIDNIVGGIPADGPIVAYGLTGVGKSFWLAKLVMEFLKKYPRKKAVIYTLEMSAEHWLARTVNMYPEIKKVLSRLMVSGAVHNIEELVAEVTVQQADLVGLDDMDGIVEDESPSAYQKVYKRIREICRFLKIPMAVLAQPNRATKQVIEDGVRFLNQYDIAWSGAGENAAALLVALQRASKLNMQSQQFPLCDTDCEYMIFWKSRDGWPKQQGPGAIRLDQEKQLWSGKAFQNRLWRPMARGSQIGTGNGNGHANGNGRSRR